MEREEINLEISRVATILRVIGDTNRLHILSLLNQHELCVCELTSILNATQSNVSQHLAKLKAVGLVNERRSAQWIYYSLNAELIPIIREILEIMPDVSAELKKVEGVKNGLSCKNL